MIVVLGNDKVARENVFDSDWPLTQKKYLSDSAAAVPTFMRLHH